MLSIYADRLQNYGRDWYRPWMVLLGLTAIVGVPLYLTSSVATPYWPPADVTVDPSKPNITLPPPSPSRFRSAVLDEETDLVWTADLHDAIAEGYRNRQWVFVAIDGVTDANARMNRRMIRERPRLRELLGHYRLVVLYLDAPPAEYYAELPTFEQRCEDGQRSQRWERDVLDTLQEPLYIILRPTSAASFQIHSIYDEAIIHEPDQFARFLQAPSKR